MVGHLGRLTPPDFEHVEKYPLHELGAAGPTNVPVVLGVNWYTSFDEPVQTSDGSFHVPDSSKANLGTVRGGHCVCLCPAGGAVKALDPAWQIFYNQGETGACEGFGHSHAQSIMRRDTFAAFWLYDQARKYEHNTGEGSCNRSVCAVLKATGLRRESGKHATQSSTNDGPVEASLGISAYRWATTAEEVCNALGRPNASAVPLLNSWGTEYPAVVWMPVDTLERLLQEQGEADIMTDR